MDSLLILLISLVVLLVAGGCAALATAGLGVAAWRLLRGGDGRRSSHRFEAERMHAWELTLSEEEEAAFLEELADYDDEVAAADLDAPNGLLIVDDVVLRVSWVIERWRANRGGPGAMETAIQQAIDDEPTALQLREDWVDAGPAALHGSDPVRVIEAFTSALDHGESVREQAAGMQAATDVLAAGGSLDDAVLAFRANAGAWQGYTDDELAAMEAGKLYLGAIRPAGWGLADESIGMLQVRVKVEIIDEVVALQEADRFEEACAIEDSKGNLAVFDLAEVLHRYEGSVPLDDDPDAVLAALRGSVVGGTVLWKRDPTPREAAALLALVAPLTPGA